MAFFALTGICVVGLYISYVIPVFLRRRNPDFEPGPWNLGYWSPLVGWAAVAWVVLVGVVFCAPVFYPWKTWETFNFTGPILILSAIFVGLWWSLSAKNHFTGPKAMGSVDDLIARELELAQEGEAMHEHHHLHMHEDDMPSAD